MRDLDKSGMKSFGALDSRRKRLLYWEIDGGHSRRNTTGIRYVEDSCVVYERNVMSTSLLEVSLLGVGTVLRLERDAWSMVQRLRQATDEYAPPLS